MLLQERFPKRWNLAEEYQVLTHNTTCCWCSGVSTGLEGKYITTLL